MSIEPAFLLPDEVEMLTGFKTFGRQIEWLRSKGWRFELSGSKRPIIARRYAEAVLGYGQHQQPGTKPNFAALRII